MMNPPCQPRQGPPQPPPQQQPQPQGQNAPPQRRYNNVPPPNNYSRPGLKRSSYPPLPESLEDIFFALLAANAIQLPQPKESMNPNVDKFKYCPYHRMPGHELRNCFTFKDWIYDMNDEGRINWHDVKVAVAKLPKKDLGIVRDPLPAQQPHDPQCNAPQVIMGATGE